MSKAIMEWVESKSNDWKVCTIKEGSQTITGVSVNRVNKKGEVFPDFDKILPGAEIECEIWNSTAGKTYMFAPKPQSAPKSGFSGGGVKAAQERKAEMIEQAQSRKSDSIAYFNSVNSAIALVSKYPMFEKMNDQELENAIVQWREWFLSEYRKYEALDLTDKRNAI